MHNKILVYGLNQIVLLSHNVQILKDKHMNNVKFIQLIVQVMVIIVFHYKNVDNILIIIVVKKEQMEHVVGLWV